MIFSLSQIWVRKDVDLAQALTDTVIAYFTAEHQHTDAQGTPHSSISSSAKLT